MAEAYVNELPEEERMSAEQEMGMAAEAEQPFDGEGEAVEDFGEAIDDGEPVEEITDPEVVVEAAQAVESTGADITTDSFGELRLPQEQIDAAQETWRMLVNAAASKEAVGEAIYSAFFDAAPSLQHMFTTPRAIVAMKFFAGIDQFIRTLGDPSALKVMTETLGFGHMALDITVPRVVIMRDAFLDLLQVELGSKMTNDAYKGLNAMLNYIGGAIVFIKAFYAERLRQLAESWALANNADSNKEQFATMASQEGAQLETAADDAKNGKPQGVAAEGEGEGNGKSDSMVQNVPTTFKEMFQFNAAVMGFGSNLWMNEVLAVFDNIVTNSSNPARLLEECEVLTCRIAKVTSTKVNLAGFKSCMLASLRSLLPKVWTTGHEVAWSWLWETVERTLMKNMGMPPVWEKAYAKLLDSIDEATGFQLRNDIFAKFFALAPSGQDYFKQSITYMHLIATKNLILCIDIYRDPVRVVDDISAIGLRHVGYGIPTEFMGPWASACVEVLQGLTKDQNCIDGFQWAIGLVSKSLMRTIIEGSTIVMKAINQNTKKSLHRAVSIAPRGERASWQLMIQVGTQNISPLAWSVSSGATESASAIINDLLTMRADRDRYYFHADDMFKRHPDIIKLLLNDAPTLVPELLDGLIWRSRVTINGTRRVNYYVRHLLIDPDGKFHKNLDWVVKARDPRLVCHPTLTLLSDIVWSGVAMRSFVVRKLWFLFTLFLFIVSQSVLEHMVMDDTGRKSEPVRYTAFVFRAFIYLFSLGQMLYQHAARTMKAYRNYSTDTIKLFGRVRIPKYLENWQDSVNLLLMICLTVMLAFEPILHCLQDSEGEAFTDNCEGSAKYKVFPYSFFSMLAMFIYYSLLMDLAVFNNRVSAYVLVVGRMLAEVALFLLAVTMLLLTFSSGFSCLDQKLTRFQSIPGGSLLLWEALLQLFGGYETLSDEPVIQYGTFVYLIVAFVFLLNMLVAQLTCSYSTVYADMVGYARLKRIQIIVESMPQVSPKRWERWTDSLDFEKRIEFNEGDVGVGNGIATTEASNLHPTLQDRIARFGGSTSPDIQWPEESNGDDEGDKFERLEVLIKRAMERMASEKKRRGGVGSSSAGASGSGAAAAEGSGEAAAEGSGVYDEE